MYYLKMCDLGRQYKILEKEMLEAFHEVMQSEIFIGGPTVARFEEELVNYQGCKHAITCGNGTDAIQLLLMALKLPKGAKILVPSYTFAATVEVVKLLEFEPVYVDVDESYNICPDDLAKKISTDCAAIICVHLFGQMAEMNEINQICNNFDVIILEDNAQSIGSSMEDTEGNLVKAGNWGIASTTSFFPSKNLGAYGDGGAVFTNDDQLANSIRTLKNHGSKRKYEYLEIGINSRLDSLQAAFLSIKLKNLDHYNELRRCNAQIYSDLIKNIDRIKTPEVLRGQHVFHQYVVRVNPEVRNDLQDFLKDKNVQTMIYYPQAIHEFPIYNVKEIHLPNTMKFTKEVLALPMHPYLYESEIEYIVDQCQQFFNSNDITFTS